MSIKVEYKYDNGVYYYSLDGDGDNVSAEGLFEKILEQVGGGARVVLNLEKLSFCNSKFLGNMFFFAEMLDKRRSKAVMFGCNQAIKDVFEVVGMFDEIPYFNTSKEAIDFITK